MLTIADLRKVIRNLPDDLPVFVCSHGYWVDTEVTDDLLILCAEHEGEI